MNYKVLYIIERILLWIITIIFLPIILISILSCFIYKIFNYLVSLRNMLINFISHKLFLCCDNKDIIKDEFYYDQMTMKAFYQYIKEKNN